MKKHTLLSCLVPLAATAWVVLPGSDAVPQEASAKAAAQRPLVGIWGANSRIEHRSCFKVTGAKQMTDLWLKHVGKDPKMHSAYYNKAGVPDIDFKRCMVVAIFQGSAWNSAGVSVHSITEHKDHILVRYDDRSYQTAGPEGGGKKTTAFGFFVVPQSSKAVVFEENVQNLKGRPPKWKERAKL